MSFIEHMLVSFSSVKFNMVSIPFLLSHLFWPSFSDGLEDDSLVFDLVSLKLC